MKKHSFRKCFVFSIEKCTKAFDSTEYLQVFEHDVSNFAQKFDCVDLMLNERARRAESGGSSTDVYRCRSGNAKNLFSVSFNDSAISVHKYDPIIDRWTHIRDIEHHIANPCTAIALTLANNVLCHVHGIRQKVHQLFARNVGIGTIHSVIFHRSMCIP